MTLWDWFLVVALNGSIIAYGLYLSRDVQSSSDWFLAGRRLPWWLVGVSMYATAIDSSDLVADSGATYRIGFSFLTLNWVGLTAGWGLAAFFVFPPMYRAGMYTNAEYLEARYGTALRVISTLVQVQYRTSVLAIIGMSVYYTLDVLCRWGPAAWWAVGAIAVVASIYTALGGLRSVAVTDALQFGVMTIAALVIWFLVWNEVGGWSGIEERLATADAELPAQLLHAGHDHVVTENCSTMTEEEIKRKLVLGGQYDPDQGVIIHRTPAWIFSLALIIVGIGYSIVNHTQSMRMFASKSEWDMKMSVFVAGVILLVMCFFNLSIGVMGRALVPDESMLQNGADTIYPFLVSSLSTVGLTGIIVAGILAASLSTFDSIGSSLSSLLTRDVYARLIVLDADDRHYRRVGQWLTPAVIGISFLYVPFMLEGGMVPVYLEITSTFVTPLLTLYLMGTFTTVHRRSGLIGFLAGAVYGIVRLVVAPLVARHFGIAILPSIMMNREAAYIFSMIVTAGTMILISLIYGWEPRGKLLHEEKSGWLRASQREIRDLDHPSLSDTHGRWSHLLPAVLAVIVVAMGCVLSFVVFW